MPGALLVNDLEHLFRNLRRHQSENTRLRNVKVGLVIRFVGFSAFLPNVAIFSTFWQYRFKDLERMGEGAFVQYFQRVYFKKIGQYWSATWFCGLMGKVQSGHAASQNLVEAFNSQLRKVAKEQGHHRDATKLLKQLAARMLLWTCTRGDKLSICGEGQTKQALPSPSKPSKDLIKSENGRTVKVAGRREGWLVASGSNIHPVHPVFFVLCALEPLFAVSHRGLTWAAALERCTSQ